jgi:hypothetical protein
MTRIITISTGNIRLEAELDETPAADAVWNTLPYEAPGSVWGDELYFRIPEELDLDPENGQDVVEAGDLGYWPVGNAFCIFYGPTPASTDERPRPASPVTVFGKVIGDADGLSEVRAGVMVFVRRKE